MGVWLALGCCGQPSLSNQNATGGLVILIVRAIGLALAIAVFASSARAEVPATKLISGSSLSDPAWAQSQYGPSTQHSTTAAAWTGTPPEISALARTLGADRASTSAGRTQFIQNVFDYVRKNIETEFRFGLSKGGRGALIDQSGTPFDQAELMVELLMRGGVTGTYDIGTISLTGKQFGQWTGLVTSLTADGLSFTVDAAAACRLLADGGIPATVSGQGACSGTLSSNAAAVTMAHVWVSVDGNLYDPAFKPHTFKPRADLATAMGCGTEAAPTCGSTIRALVPQGASFPTVGTYSTIQNANAAGVMQKVWSFAGSLQHYIEASPNSELDDLIGGERIDLTYSPAVGSSLPYPSSVWPAFAGLTSIPNQFRSTLRIVTGDIDQTFYADEIATRRLRIYGGGANQQPAQPTLYVDDTAIQACTTCSDRTLIVTATHPYLQSGDSSDSLVVSYDAPGFLEALIVQTWGEASPSTAKYFADLQAADPDPFSSLTTSTCSANSCTNGDVEPVYASSLAVQRSLSNRIIGALTGTIITNHHTIGLIGVAGLSTASTMSVAPTNSSAPDDSTAFEVASLVQSTLEGSVPQQSLHSPHAISTPHLITLENAQGDTFVYVPADQTVAAGSTLGWGSTWFNSLSAENYATITTVEQGNFAISNLFTAPYYGDVAFKAGRISYLLHRPGSLIALKGGAAIPPTGVDPTVEALKTVNAMASGRRTSEATVDVATGALNVNPPPDLVSGAGEFPYSLPFRRFYTSASGTEERFLTYSGQYVTWTYAGPDENSSARLPGGWSYNYAVTARITSNAQKAFGRDTALDASAAIATIYVLKDLLHQPDFYGRMGAMFAADYLTQQLADNAVVVSTPPGQEIFMRLPDNVGGSVPPTAFHAQPGSASSLQMQGLPALATGVGTTGVAWDYAPILLTYVTSDGASIRFDTGSKRGMIGVESGSTISYVGDPIFKAQTWTFPTGISLSFFYSPEEVNWSNFNKIGPNYIRYTLDQVKNSFGRSLSFSTVQTGPCVQYQVDNSGNPIGQCQTTFNVGRRITAVTDETGRSAQIVPSACAALLAPFTTMGLACGKLAVIGPANNKVQYDYTADSTSPDPIVVERPNYLMRHLYSAWDVTNNASPMLSFTYDDMLRVATQVDSLSPPRQKTFYAAGLLDGELYTRGEVVDAAAAHWISVFDYRSHRTEAIDPLQRVTQYAYDGMGRLVRTTYPELNSEELTYDLRSNLISSCKIAKNRAGQHCNQQAGDLLTTMKYGEPGALTCLAPATCNKLSTLIDPRGQPTRFFWTTFGELSEILKPADKHGVQPRTDFAYTPYTIGVDTVQFLTSRTDWINATTTTTTQYDYNAANKFVLLDAIVDKAGYGLKTQFTFDPVGNLTSVDGPLDGAGDTSLYGWDADRHLVLAVQPFGANGLRTATKTTYDPDGLVTAVQQGTATSADPNSSDFHPITYMAFAYDSVGNKTFEEAVDPNNNAILTLTQFSYDPEDRLQCTAVRMNPSSFNTSTIACAQGASGAGVDRITRNTYDGAGQLVTVEKGVGSTAGVNTQTTWINFERFQYNPNGTRASLTDAVNNVTGYKYDDFDRLSEMDFPSAMRGSGAANTNDAEKYGYDANGNRITLTKRSGDEIVFGYDNLNRMIFKDIPGGTASDVTYDYDLVGHQTLAAYPSDGKSIVDQYDTAGRKSAEISYGWEVEYKYDNAGNRIRLTWPDHIYTTYDYDGASRLSDIVQHDPTTGSQVQLVSFVYDGLGRRTQLNRWNQTSTTYDYDPAGRLKNLQNSLPAGQPTDIEQISYNPAGQVRSLTHNDPYVWKGQPTTTQNDAHDGLNRISRLLALSSSAYDLNGNLKNDGTFTYNYDVENRMTQAIGPTTGSIEAYDPLGRLRARFPTPAAPTYLLEDGDHIIAEYAAKGLPQSGGTPTAPPLRRYIFGPGTDEPLVWYEGSTPYWLHADRQGSIIAWSDSAGVVTNTASNTNRTLNYGPYGEPSSWTAPRFAYTGQAALPEDQLYYYKARVYSPALGRFLQTDPVGYDADTNLYAYVQDDPTDKTDPTGECPNCITGGIGFVVGGLVGGGLEIANQFAQEGRVSDWGGVGTASLGGAVAGGITGLTGCGACGGAAGAFVQSASDEARHNTGDLKGAAVRVAAATAVGGVLGSKGASKVIGARGSNAVAKNERMAQMIGGRLAKGQITRVSPTTAAKIVGAGTTKAILPTVASNAAAKVTSCAQNQNQKGC
jgi:RHS repeat-associated protein